MAELPNGNPIGSLGFFVFWGGMRIASSAEILLNVMLNLFQHLATFIRCKKILK